MFTAIFATITIFQLVFFIGSGRLYIQNRLLFTLLVLLTMFGLFYDNLIILLGNAIGEGGMLEGLSLLRFYMHGTITPLLIMYGWWVAKELDIQWAKTNWAWVGFVLLTAAMVALGIYDDIIHLALVPEFDSGVLRYTNDNSAGPPIPSIMVVIVLIIVGGYVWRQHRWPILCLGSVIMFVFSAVGASSLILANIGEVFFAATLLLTEYRLRQARPEYKVGLAAPAAS